MPTAMSMRGVSATASHMAGVLRSPDAKHEGEWKKGKKHGKGVLKFADGGAFEGDWKEGQQIGGKYTWSSTYFFA